MKDSRPADRGVFHSTILVVVAIFVFLKWVFPSLSRIIAGSEHPLPVPGALMAAFMALSLLGAAVYLSISDERLRALKAPLLDLLSGRPAPRDDAGARVGLLIGLAALVAAGALVEGPEADLLLALLALLAAATTLARGRLFRWARRGLFVAFPLLVAWVLYSHALPSLKTPTVLRIQHPTIPRSFEKLENPFRRLPAARRAQYLLEGRVLYQKNCRPCHGTKAAGDGPMARAFRLKPANFRDPGTIATVVESYAFWRIKKGGPGLPRAASPWDSAMPVWGKDLKDEEIWKIIMAEYQTAGVEPRRPEKTE